MVWYPESTKKMGWTQLVMYSVNRLQFFGSGNLTKKWFEHKNWTFFFFIFFLNCWPFLMILISFTGPQIFSAGTAWGFFPWFFFSILCRLFDHFFEVQQCQALQGAHHFWKKTLQIEENFKKSPNLAKILKKSLLKLHSTHYYSIALQKPSFG